MKKTVIFQLILLVASSYASFAQDCNPVKYALPQFGDGIVQLDDGSRQSGKFNVCLIDQSIHFVQGGDTLVLADNMSAVQVSIGRHLFKKERMKYSEIIDYCDDIFLGLEKNTVITNNFKQGAYGTVSATASIDSYSRNEVTGMYHDSVLDDPNNYVYEELFVLIKGSKCYNLTKKTLIKCFPQKKEYIENCFAKEDFDCRDRQDVISLFDSLKH